MLSEQYIAIFSSGYTFEPLAPSWATMFEWYDQRWFWTAQWQAGEREADRDLAQGRGTLFLTDEAFLASLDE